jgi:hypothetical protein
MKREPLPTPKACGPTDAKPTAPDRHHETIFASQLASLLRDAAQE